MPEFLLLVVVALVVGALVFGAAVMVTGSDPGLTPAEPDGTSRGLPGDRPLVESDLHAARFDTALRGYRMAQVDAVLARAAYDIGFKQELIEALYAEAEALREGRTEDAEVLRKAREAAAGITRPDSDAPVGLDKPAGGGTAPDGGTVPDGETAPAGGSSE
ncbi:MAG: DivIVA domain-containing protein [Micromonosporaceae bacterium]